MKQILQKLHEHEYLSELEAKEILIDISNEKYNEAEVTAFISVFLMRSISVPELTGFRDALIEMSIKTNIDSAESIDLCGTGGDGKNTFNISTITSVVAAAAGLKVTKHGNYGVSSACGSSNVLEALGYKFTNDSDKLREQLDQCNICFLHAPLFHPAMKFVGPIRRNLKIKTFFNMLGPLVNPVQPEFQSVGVFSLKLQRLYHYMLQQSNKKYNVIHDLAGYDEVSLTGITKISAHSGDYLIQADEFGAATVLPSDIFGGNTVEEAKAIFENILKNTCTDAQRSVVCANTALALKLSNEDKSYADLYMQADEVLRSGKAATNFKKLLDLAA